MKIELWDHNGAGVIFSDKTGIIWSNQCGGTCCSHPEMEGVFVPLNTTPEDMGQGCLWCDAWAIDYNEYLKEIHEVESLWGFLGRVTEEEFNQLIPVSEYRSCGEAWIPVKVVKPDSDGVWMSEQMKPFIGKIGILTYPNSD